jgi:hypothetical protein
MKIFPQPNILVGVDQDIRVILDCKGTHLSLSLNSPQRVEEFKELMQRALNTWEDPQPWAVEIMDALTNTPRPGKRGDTP